jgi:uncharacterized membrane protein
MEWLDWRGHVRHAVSALVGMGIAGVAMLARWLVGSRRQQDEGEDRALAVLRERYARG